MRTRSDYAAAGTAAPSDCAWSWAAAASRARTRGRAPLRCRVIYQPYCIRESAHSNTISASSPLALDSTRWRSRVQDDSLGRNVERVGHVLVDRAHVVVALLLGWRAEMQPVARVIERQHIDLQVAPRISITRTPSTFQRGISGYTYVERVAQHAHPALDLAQVLGVAAAVEKCKVRTTASTSKRAVHSRDITAQRSQRYLWPSRPLQR